MLHELENFASRILNGDDFEVIDHNINRSIHLIFTDGFEVTLSRQRRNGEDVYFFTHGAALPHHISYYRDYEEYDVAESLAEAFLITENF